MGCVGDISETSHLALLGRMPLLPIKYADSAYVVPVELLYHSIPPENVTVLVGDGSEM